MGWCRRKSKIMRSINWILSDIFHYLVTASSPCLGRKERETQLISLEKQQQYLRRYWRTQGKGDWRYERQKFRLSVDQAQVHPAIISLMREKRSQRDPQPVISQEENGDLGGGKHQRSNNQPEDLWMLDQLQVFGYQKSLEWQPVFVLKTDFPLFSRK